MTTMPGSRLSGFDDVTIPLLDPAAQVVLYYADGRYVQQAAALRARCPRAILVPISVSAGFVVPRARRLYLDDEPGDANDSQVLGWYDDAKRAGVQVPGVYTSISNAESVCNILEHAGKTYGVDFALHSAHYTGVPHLCSPSCGFGFTRTAHNTQWTDRAEGRSLDADLCTPFGVGISPSTPRASGIARAELALNLSNRNASVHGAPGKDVQLSHDDIWLPVTVEINERTGAWRVK